jgi:lipopolysaccharide transport system permease protein
MDQHQKITVYTPESGLRNPVDLLSGMFKDLRNSHELGWRFFVRNFSAMYRQSVLGFVWAFIPPLMTALVWIFLNGQRIINIEDPGIPYPAFVLTSVLLWSVFAQALLAPITTMLHGKSILVKINFPREALILAAFYQIILDFVIKIVLIIGVFIIFDVTPAATIALVPLGILALILGGMALGLILLPVGMLYTDIQRIIIAITPFWMLLTPVIYPAPRAGIATVLNKFNPVSPLLSTTRDWMFHGQSDFIVPFLWISGGSLFLLFAGLILFRLAMPIIIERSGS